MAEQNETKLEALAEAPSFETGSDSASWQTIKRSPKSGWPFSSRMAVSFAVVAGMTALILTLVLAIVWSGGFQEYTRQNMERLAQSTANRLSERYIEVGEWTPEVLSAADAASSISNDIIVQVIDETGTVLYDDTWASRRNDAQLQKTFGDAEEMLPPTSSNSIITSPVLDADGNTIATVRLWAFGSDALLTKNDTAFRRNSYQAIVVAALAAIALASIFGYFAARSLARPIRRITSTASQIRNGDLSARTGLAGEDEIGRLGETFDDMATTLERDLDREHRLTSDVAHELRTPLMAMLATVEAMQDGVLPADDEHFEIVASEVRRLSKHVDAMLRLSRVENSSLELVAERTEMVSLVSNLVNSQRQLFHDKGLHLRFSDDTNRGECYADVDADLIREAIVNLLSNAFRYTPEDGWVVVSIAHSRGECRITVEDTGIGIAKEDIPRTFSRFWRSDVSRERESGGLGVGLALTKEIIDRHNGVIRVESKLGQGSRFILRIPTHRGRLLPQLNQKER